MSIVRFYWFGSIAPGRLFLEEGEGSAEDSAVCAKAGVAKSIHSAFIAVFRKIAIQAVAGQPTGVSKIRPEKVSAVSGILGCVTILVGTQTIFPCIQRVYGNRSTVMCAATTPYGTNSLDVSCRTKENSGVGGKVIAQAFPFVRQHTVEVIVCSISTARHSINSI